MTRPGGRATLINTLKKFTNIKDITTASYHFAVRGMMMVRPFLLALVFDDAQPDAIHYSIAFSQLLPLLSLHEYSTIYKSKAWDRAIILLF